MLVSSMTCGVLLTLMPTRPKLLPPLPLLLGLPRSAPFRRRLLMGISCISFCMHIHSPSSAVTARLAPCSAHLQASGQACRQAHAWVPKQRSSVMRPRTNLLPALTMSAAWGTR